MGLTTGMVGGGGGDARPMTSVSGAGYKGSAGRDSRAFDPLNLGKGPAPPLAEKSDNSHEDRAKEMEKGVHRLIEASAEALATKNLQQALDKAKEAGKAERALCKFREGHALVEQINLDLTYAICFNLANAYYHNKMYEEALNTYQLIVKNKQYPQSGRLRVNMGNIYYEQKKYFEAIKQYRMALDQIPSTGKELRFRIFRNIGNARVKLAQWPDAIDSYDSVMQGSPDIQTAFNLLLCLYARGDKDKIRKHFIKMLSIPIPGMTDDDEEKLNDPDLNTERQDALKEELVRRKENYHESILTAARLIAPMIDEKDDWVAGYKWVMEQLRQDYEAVSSKLELDLSMAYMKKRQFEDAIEVLKGFERKDASMKAMAATNLSFIYFLEGDYQQAEKQADISIKNDRYNAKALVNKGNCLYAAGDFNRAKEMYLEAVGVEADCVEAIYNLGLVNLKLNAVQEAHHAFDKLHTVLPSVEEALFQMGSIYERGGSQADLEQAAKTYEVLLNKLPGDPNLCSKLGQVYEKLEDDNAACHWMMESHKCYPVNLNVIR
jgi:intraflagellar transport protein 88